MSFRGFGVLSAFLLAALASASAGNEVAFDAGPLAGSGSSDEPISIVSDELEAEVADGKKAFIFKRNVRVVQGDMTLTTDELEAFYPQGSNDPNRLVARGSVVMVQQDKELVCDEAVYDRKEDRLTCAGNAVMTSGADRLSGDRIEFGIESGVVKVFGGVQVNVIPRSEEDESAAEGASDSPEGGT